MSQGAASVLRSTPAPPLDCEIFVPRETFDRAADFSGLSTRLLRVLTRLQTLQVFRQGCRLLRTFDKAPQGFDKIADSSGFLTRLQLIRTFDKAADSSGFSTRLQTPQDLTFNRSADFSGVSTKPQTSQDFQQGSGLLSRRGWVFGDASRRGDYIEIDASPFLGLQDPQEILWECLTLLQQSSALG